MKNMIRKQPFKVCNMLFFFATLISILIVSDLTYAELTPIKDYLLQIPIPKVKRVEGIAWDGKNLFVLDGEKEKIHRINPDSGELVQSLVLKKKKLKGLSFDEKERALWTADEGKKTLMLLDPSNGKTLKTIPMKIPVRFDSIEGIAWDGEYLWLAMYAGFSSSFNKINLKTGEIERSMFADCYPRGIATDGKELWSICYNMNKFPSKIDKRKMDKEDHKMLRSRTFIEDIDKDAEPTGLVFDGKHLWYADRMSKRIIRVTPTIIKPVKPPVKPPAPIR
ncbi:MAG: hypothetical protein DWB56_05950 [Candidatus Jettenia sp.]|nr:hypothetical protein [Candidatus Jettenia sp. AMX1]MBC6928495.1 hypothetical protein [Candidatus Jettenia sp.]NUN23166.1 hypothetical protein [Candidatus Jettenia caeni]MDL1937631.1 hypothetical protein [Candidatus Jettenia sp. AMX1]WKZ16564.1 MAG: hypothetical protein QY317_04485 [Candidatus Jettenia caeni]GIL20779.1 MAG: hypothetical protein BroJett041_18930 [Candidatus Jettenia caeni]